MLRAQSRLNLNKSKKTLSVKDADLDTFAGVNPMQGDPEDRPGNPMHEGAPEAPQLGRGHVHVGPQMKADLLVMQRSVLVRCVRIACVLVAVAVAAVRRREGSMKSDLLIDRSRSSRCRRTAERRRAAVRRRGARALATAWSRWSLTPS